AAATAAPPPSRRPPSPPPRGGARLGLPGATRRQHARRTASRESQRRLPTDARRRPGHDHRPTSKVHARALAACSPPRQVSIRIMRRCAAWHRRAMTRSRMTTPKRVFILGGGAALGAHQVGAIKYLGEQGVPPDAIVASSIGVINACAYACGGVERLEQSWREFRSIPQIISPSLRHNPLWGYSLFSMDRLSAAVERFIDFRDV